MVFRLSYFTRKCEAFCSRGDNRGTEKHVCITSTKNDFNHRNVIHLIVFVTPQMWQILASSNHVSDFWFLYPAYIYQNIYIANHKYGYGMVHENLSLVVLLSSTNTLNKTGFILNMTTTNWHNSLNAPCCLAQTMHCK